MLPVERHLRTRYWAAAGIAATRTSSRRMNRVADMGRMSSRYFVIRAAEQALAGQQPDLHNIRSGISRIEAQLEKLQPRP